MHPQNPDLLSAGNPVWIKDDPLLLKGNAFAEVYYQIYFFACMIRNKETDRCVSLDLYKI